SALAFRLRNWRSPDSRRLLYLEYVLANDDHAKEVKLFGLGPMLLDRYRSLGETFYLEDRKLAIQRAGWGTTLSLLATGAFYVCYALMGVATAAGKLTLRLMTLSILALRQGQQAFQSILAAIGGMYEDNLYMSNLFAYLAIPTGRALPAPEPAALPAAVEEGIRFEEVGFRYPEAEGWALRHISLFIPRG